MKLKIRLIFWLAIFMLWLVGCREQAELLPTPLPTAVPPPEQEPGDWAISFSFEFPEEAWAIGVHRYQYFARCPVITLDDFSTEWIYFEVLDDEVLFEDAVYLRISGLSTGILAPATMDTINVQQKTVAVITFLGVSEHIAELAADNCEVLLRWDDKSPQLLTIGEVFLH